MQGGDPAAPQTVTSTCKLGWLAGSLTTGYPVSNVFHPGSAAGAHLPSSEKPFDAFQVAITNGTSLTVLVSWINATFYLHGKQVGGQQSQSDMPDSIAPGQTDSSWAQLIVPGEAGSNWPASAPSGPMENVPGVSCQLTNWGNSTG